MNLFFHTNMPNVWIPYYTKYFNSIPDIKFNIEFNKSGINIELIKQSDCTVFLWANDPIIALSNKMAKLSKKYVVIIRSYEVFYGHLSKINWGVVDDAIFVNKSFYDDYKDRLPCKCHYVPNAIDCEKWKFQEGHKPSLKLGWVANLNHKKGINLLPQILHGLKEKNVNYKLHVVGDIQEPRFINYCEHLFEQLDVQNNIVFEGYCKNIQEWWKDKDYCLTCSVTEGHPNNVLEAMAMGVKPIIHNWPGAKDSFPNELVWSSLKECIDSIDSQCYNSEYYRKFIEDNYDIWKVYPKLEEIIRS